MPWYFPWSESIKKRACRYILQHYMGHFLKEKLTLDQLSLDIYDGRGEIKDVQLDIDSVNETLKSLKSPLELVDGFVGEIVIVIPWSSLMENNTTVEIRNLEMTVRARGAESHATSWLSESSLWSSSHSAMAVSLQIAQEIQHQEQKQQYQRSSSSSESKSSGFEGLDSFAQTIESILCRIRVSLIDTIVRLETPDDDDDPNAGGKALELHVQHLEFYDEIANAESTSYWEPPAFLTKIVTCDGVKLYVDDYKSSAGSSLQASGTSGDSEDEIFQSATESGFKPCSSGEETSPISAPILIMAVAGQTTVSVKMKQKENLPGVALQIDCQLGAVHFFATPHQILLLADFSARLADSASASTRSRHRHHRRRRDRCKVEHELQRQLHQERMALHKQHQQAMMQRPLGIGEEDLTLSLNLDDDSDDFYSLHGRQGRRRFPGNAPSISSTEITNSICSGVSGATSSTPSSAASPTYASSDRSKSGSASKRDREANLAKSNAASDATLMRIRVSIVAGVLTHETPAIPSSLPLAERLTQMAERYFEKALAINCSGSDDIGPAISACAASPAGGDHLRFLVKPFNLSTTEKSSPKSGVSSRHLDAALGSLEVVECLFDERRSSPSASGRTPPLFLPLLAFSPPPSPAQPSPDSPFVSSNPLSPALALRLVLVHNESPQHPGRSFEHLDVVVELGHPCRLQIDPTLIDRLHRVLNGLSSRSARRRREREFQPYSNSTSAFLSASQNEVSSETSFRFETLPSSRLDIEFRFPVPDRRPLNDPGRAPWWRRTLRPERLHLEARGLRADASFADGDVRTVLHVEWEELRGSLQMDEGEEAVPMLSMGMWSWPNKTRIEDDPACPVVPVRIKIVVHPRSPCDVDDEDLLEEFEGEDDDDDAILADERKEPSPFSDKKVMYEDEEMVMPGSKSEIIAFVNSSIQKSELVVEITVPVLSLHLPSKHFLEIIYNRLCLDLPLWSPAAPPSEPTQPPHPPYSWAGAGGGAFQMSRPMVHGDFDSDDDDDTAFYSTFEPRSLGRRKMPKNRRSGFSKFAFKLTVDQTRLLACLTSHREEEKPLDEQRQQPNHSELVLDVKTLDLFVVASFRGDPDLQYTCLQANYLALYFAEDRESSLTSHSLGAASDALLRPFTPLPPEFFKTAFTSGSNVPTKLADQVGNGPDSRDVLTLAVRSTPEARRNINTHVVSVCAAGLTLRVTLHPPGRSPLEKLLDFVGVIDYPVEGFDPPAVVTELHLHVCSSAVDYRPLHIPYAAVMTVEQMSISSNLVYECDSSLLRFIVDEACVLVSDRNVPYPLPLNLREDYVCVASLENFELTLLLNPESRAGKPKIDARMSSNAVRINTCADSCGVLLSLLSYLASDGDFAYNPSASAAPEPDDEREQQRDELSLSQAERVNISIADAMMESDDEEEETMEAASAFPPTTAFFRRDEDQVSLGVSASSPFAEVPAIGPASFALDEAEKAREEALVREVFSDVGRSNDRRSIEDYGDDDFCVIDEPGLGIAPRDGEPSVKRYFPEETIVVEENHFVAPVKKRDAFAAPDGFPLSEIRFAVQEISLFWNLYGGSDFDPRPNRHRPLSARKNDLASWRSAGGRSRDHRVLVSVCVHKLRFLHEQYPERAPQASRQILLVHEAEILDRLEASHVNKLLYHFTSERYPRRSNADMAHVRAMHLRPNPEESPGQLECSLKVSLMPIALNIDQDTLFFLKDFFLHLSSVDVVDSMPTTRRDREPDDRPIFSVAPASMPADLASQPLSSSTLSALEADLGLEEAEHLAALIDETKEAAHVIVDRQGAPTTTPLLFASASSSSSPSSSSSSSSAPVYFKTFVFSPELPIHIDYHGRHVDMQQGPLIGLLVGITHLSDSQVTLKRLSFRHGVLGVDRLLVHAIDEWLNDVKRNQIPYVLGGVGPVASVVQIVRGIKDLIFMPIDQYRRDGRIILGLQRGTQSFGASTALAAIEMSNRAVNLFHCLAETMYEMLSPGPALRSQRRRRQIVGPPAPHASNAANTASDATTIRTLPPADLREGVSNAYQVFYSGIEDTASNIICGAAEGHDEKGVTGAVGGVLRQIPPTLVRPLVLASEATANVLGGMRNQIAPEARRRDAEKWRHQN